MLRFTACAASAPAPSYLHFTMIYLPNITSIFTSTPAHTVSFIAIHPYPTPPKYYLSPISFAYSLSLYPHNYFASVSITYLLFPARVHVYLYDTPQVEP